MGKLWSGVVKIVSVPSGRFYALIRYGDGSQSSAFVGEWRQTESEALRDAASWLEDRGYVHGTTHDLGKDGGS